MRWLAASVALFALQEAPDRDLAATYRAISDLVDRPSESESRILSPFHRQVLESELKTRKELGNLYGTATRIQLKGKGLTFGDYVEQINRQTGWQLSKEYHPPGKGFDLNTEGWPVEAAVILAERAGMRFQFEGAWNNPVVRAWSTAGEFKKAADRHRWFFLRGFAVRAEAGGWHKVVDFSGPPIWSVDVAGQIQADPSLNILRYVDAEVLEALDEKGRTISTVRTEELAIPSGNESLVWNPPLGFNLRLGAEGATSLSRLRIRLKIQQATEVRQYMVTTFDPSKPVKLGDGDFDVEVGVQQGLRSDGDCVYGRVIPKKVRHADLAEIPLFMGFQFDKPGPSGQMTRFTGKGEGTTVQSRWCTVRPADQVDQRIIEAYRGVRRPVKVELVVPVGIRERTIYAEFRDIPLK